MILPDEYRVIPYKDGKQLVGGSIQVLPLRNGIHFSLETEKEFINDITGHKAKGTMITLISEKVVMSNTDESFVKPFDPNLPEPSGLEK